MPIKVRRVGHVNVRLPSADQARDFYGRILGLEQDPTMPFTPERGLMWWNIAGGKQIHTPIGDKVNQTPSGRAIVQHFALEVESIDEVKRVLEAEGISYDEQVLPGRTARQLFLNDPAGNLVELYQEASP